jgi:hypothetical protein
MASNSNVRLVSPDGEHGIDLNPETDAVEVVRFKALGWAEKGTASKTEGAVK